MKVVEKFEFGDRREDRVLVMESVSKGEVLGPYILRRCVSCLNPDAIEGRKYNSATVPYLEYYYPKYSYDPDLTGMNKYLLNRIKHYQGI
jgi:hypothetical protein